MAGEVGRETKSTADIQCYFLRNAALAAVYISQREKLAAYTSVCSACRKASVTWERRGGDPVFTVQGEEYCTRTVIRR